jgi:hypothetical protein
VVFAGKKYPIINLLDIRYSILEKKSVLHDKSLKNFKKIDILR